MEIISGKKCQVCGKKCEKCCSSCKKVYYCSIEHQKSDWKVHKKACRSSLCNYKICKNSQIGRHFIARQDIPAGSLILKEYPALVSFSELTPSDMMGNGKSDHVNCFTCGKKIQDLEKCFCPKCRLPICSAKCCIAKQHSEYECRYFVEKGQIFPPILSGYDFRLLMGMLGCIRAIGIKKYNPGLWAEISKLQTDFSDLNTKSFYPEIVQDIFEIFQCLGLENGRFEELYDPDVVTKISGIILINSFSTSYPEDTGKFCQSIVKRLYAKISLMSHSCFPNAIRRVGPGPDFELKIFASRDISEGEIIASCYPENFEMTFKGAFQRQLNSLKDRREFFCLCTRCLDPTEKQTFLSAVKCPLNMDLDNGHNNCPEGFMLIENPLNLSSNWICNKCGFKWNIKRILDMLEDFEKVYKDLEFENLASVQEFLDQLRGKCHPNFWLILKCEEKCVDTFVRSEKIEKGMDLEGLTFLSNILNHILEVFELSVGGIFLNRVQYMVDILMVLKVKYQLRRTDLEASHLDKSKDLDDILSIMRNIEDIREKVLAVYQDQEGCELFEYLQSEFPKDKFFKGLK